MKHHELVAQKQKLQRTRPFVEPQVASSPSTTHRRNAKPGRRPQDYGAPANSTACSPNAARLHLQALRYAAADEHRRPDGTRTLTTSLHRASMKTNLPSISNWPGVRAKQLRAHLLRSSLFRKPCAILNVPPFKVPEMVATAPSSTRATKGLSETLKATPHCHRSMTPRLSRMPAVDHLREPARRRVPAFLVSLVKEKQRKVLLDQSSPSQAFDSPVDYLVVSACSKSHAPPHAAGSARPRLALFPRRQNRQPRTTPVRAASTSDFSASCSRRLRRYTRARY